ncbi:hypothetical protein Tco_1294793, partial [Tanacetum coccineum]
SYGDLTRDGSIGGSLSRVLNLELQNPFSPTKVTGGGSDRRYHAYEAADRDTTVSRRHLLLNNSGGRRWIQTMRIRAMSSPIEKEKYAALKKVESLLDCFESLVELISTMSQHLLLHTATP